MMSRPERRLVEHQQARVDRHDQRQVQLRDHALGQGADLAVALDLGLRQESLGLARLKRGCSPAVTSSAWRTRIQRGSTATSAMNATCCISSARWRRGSRPSTSSCPSKGPRPRMAFSAVVLPAPFGPIRPTMRPAGISKSTRSSATVLP
jgi:hypothetical protein